jgi:hypothetical protein
MARPPLVDGQHVVVVIPRHHVHQAGRVPEPRELALGQLIGQLAQARVSVGMDSLYIVPDHD